MKILSVKELNDELKKYKGRYRVYKTKKGYSLVFQKKKKK